MQSIGWDAHLEREWNRYTDAQDAYILRRQREEFEQELWDLEEDLRTAQWACKNTSELERRIENLRNEIEELS